MISLRILRTVKLAIGPTGTSGQNLLCMMVPLTLVTIALTLRLLLVIYVLSSALLLSLAMTSLTSCV